MPLAGDNVYGYVPLVERIAGRHHVDVSRVVTATGCSMANFLALAALVEPGDEVLIERPTYEPLLLAAQHLGASVRRFDRPHTGHSGASEVFRVDADRVIAGITSATRAIVVTNLHNPSSQPVTEDTLRRIGAAAGTVGARVIVDEVYLDAVFDATPPSAVHLGPTFVSTNSLTKVYGLSAIRCGWVIADEPLARRIWGVNDLYENVRPFVPDWLAVAAFDRLPALRDRSRALLDTNRQMFRTWLHGRADLECAVPEWGTTVCARTLTVDATRFCELLDTRYDVSVVPGRFFELPGHVRIALCAPTEVLREGLARIGECLEVPRFLGS